MNTFAERADFDDKRFQDELAPDTSFTDDPEDGATEAEHAARNARETCDDFDAGDVETRGEKTPVKLFSVAVKWACAQRVTEKEWKGRAFESRTQTLFTITGNRIVLLLAKNAQGMKEGAHHGLVCEIFGTDFDEKTEWDEKNEKKVKARIVKRAQIFIKRNPPPVAKPKPAPAPKPTPNAETVKMLSRLRAELTELHRAIQWDDTRTAELTRKITDVATEIRRLERRESPGASASLATDSAQEEELKRLIAEQIADDTDSIGEELDKADDDSAAEAETLDHDDDGAELERSTEPWADSSLPIGATVDADCWDCPARIGVLCNQAMHGQPCIFA